MNVSLGFDIIAMILSAVAAVLHGRHIYVCHKLKTKTPEANCTPLRRPTGKIMITLSLVCVALAAVTNTLIQETNAHPHRVVKLVHVCGILLPITIVEFFVLDNI